MKNLFLLFLTFFLGSVTLQAQSENKRWEFSLSYVTVRAKTEDVTDFSSFAGIPANQLPANFQATEAELRGGFRQAFGHPRYLNGLDASGAYYVNKNFALIADFSFARRSGKRQIPNNPIFFEDNSRARRTDFDVLGGVQWKYRKHRVEPFVRGMAGIVRSQNRITLSIGDIESFRLQNDYTAFALSAGGGVDVRVNEHFAIRVLQFDYRPTFSGDHGAHLTAPSAGNGTRTDLGATRLDSSYRGGFRIGAGIVFR